MKTKPKNCTAARLTLAQEIRKELKSALSAVLGGGVGEEVFSPKKTKIQVLDWSEVYR